jgi:predicted transcriptional regulator
VSVSKSSTQVGVRVKNDLYARLVEYAAKQKRTVSWVMQDFAEQGLQREVAAKRRKAS